MNLTTLILEKHQFQKFYRTNTVITYQEAEEFLLDYDANYLVSSVCFSFVYSLAGLEFAMQTMLASNSEICLFLCLQSAVTNGVHNHAWNQLYFLMF